jgi:uncharacterized membrane protein YbhN (UPF0104 family)
MTAIVVDLASFYGAYVVVVGVALVIVWIHGDLTPLILLPAVVFAPIAAGIPVVLGVFEAASVATLKLMGIPIAIGLAATLLFRGLSYWLPMLPGILLARRETKA